MVKIIKKTKNRLKIINLILINDYDLNSFLQEPIFFNFVSSN